MVKKTKQKKSPSRKKQKPSRKSSQVGSAAEAQRDELRHSRDTDSADADVPADLVPPG
ncbi:MAG: hypothetical protein JWQ35_567 [Bacteriovoracaceae bacterium]|nr:hypothetical protein [Bacteriovoracaceae bacterium]